ELGFNVIGPFGRAREAVAAAVSDDVHAAILDVNIGGELIYPVADMLAARGVPFIFVTGYGAESIDRRFATVPVLQKPIERQVLQSAFVFGQTGSGQVANARRAAGGRSLRAAGRRASIELDLGDA